VGTFERFSASLQNDVGATVTWSASAGTIDQSGDYTAPASPPAGGVATVTASSSGASASAKVSITTTPVSIAISPIAAGTLKAGFKESFQATVTGSTNTAIDWAVADSPGDTSNPGTITSVGLYTAPSPQMATATYIITAFANADTTKSASVSIIVKPLENQQQQSFPINLGASGINSNTQDCCAGTLGSLLADQKGNQYILSNNHVMGRAGSASVGETIVQPGFVDSLCNFSVPQTVAHFTAAPPLSSGADAAIAEVVSGAVNTSGAIIGFGGIAADDSYLAAPPASSTESAAVGMNLASSGRTSGLKCGTVASINGTFSVGYQAVCGIPSSLVQSFNGQITVNGLAQPGDSGSLAVDATTSQPVALIFAGANNLAIATPVGTVLNALNSTANLTLGFVGGAQHSVTCPSTAYGYVRDHVLEAPGDGAAVSIAAEEIARVTAVKEKYVQEMMKDSSVFGMAVGPDDNLSGRAAILLYTDISKPSVTRPATLDGVSVRVIPTTPFMALGGSRDSGCTAAQKP
jgi:hypothetical protein